MILITGADGFIGNSLSSYLIKKNYTVLKAVRKIKNFDNTIQIDISKKEDIESSCNKIDTIIHLAGLNREQCNRNEKEAIKINSIGTKDLFKQAIKEKIKTFVLFSTIHVYGKELVGEIKEDDITLPYDNYAKSNLMAEQYCMKLAKNSQTKLIILRVSNVIGLSRIKKNSYWSLVANDFCQQAVKNRQININNNGMDRRDFISINSIENLIESIILMKNDEINSDIYNVGSGQTISIKNLANLVNEEYFKLFNSSVMINLGNNKSKNLNFKFNVDKIKESKLDFVSYDIRNNIREILIFCNT